MRYILLTLLLWGCYSPKKASKAFDKAYYKHPEIVAKKAAKLFPVKSDSTELVKWRLQVDSIFAEPIIEVETCQDSIGWKDRLITQIRYKVRTMPPIYRVDSAYIYTNEKQLQDTIKAKEKAERKAEIYFKIIACILIAILLFCVGYFIRNKK
jgi:hypothetical protein